MFIAASTRSNTSDGVVGLQGSSITCFTCEYHIHDCEHVKYLKQREEEECFDLPDCLVDLFAEQHLRCGTATSTRLSERIPRSISYLQIPFNMTPSMKTTFQLVEQTLDSLKAPSGVVQLYPSIPTGRSVCPKCSSGWAFEDPQRSGPQTILCFAKNRIFYCEGDYSMFF